LAALGIVSASLYATCLAFGAESLAHTSGWLRHRDEDRYRLLALNMTDVIARHGAHGAVSFISPAAERLLGVPVRQLMGHGLFDRVHVVDRPAYLKALADAAVTGDEQSVEFRVRRDAAGTSMPQPSAFIWVEMRCRPLDGSAANKGPADVVAVMRDVTGRKAQEDALERARVESERVNTAKSRVLATMSHELRTPLNVIIGFSDMLTREGQIALGAVRRIEYAQLINESGHHLLAVVNGILDMSKIESGNFEITPEPFALAGVVDTCCDLLTLKAQQCGIDLVRRVERDMPEMVADRRALSQVMLNLLSNAIKFTDRGGRVTIGAYRDGAMIAIEVEDTGVGIADDDLPRLGDPFFQARASYDRRHDGTGLGLCIVKGLVELHNGTLNIRSRVGEGTTVTVRLPIDCERKQDHRHVVVAGLRRVVDMRDAEPARDPIRKIA
jgi:cell cycle sensor histidine kinase DivJ